MPEPDWVLSVGSDPNAFGAYRDYVHSTCTRVRWRHVPHDQVGDESLPKPKLVFLDRALGNTEIKEAAERIRGRWGESLQCLCLQDMPGKGASPVLIPILEAMPQVGRHHDFSKSGAPIELSPIVEELASHLPELTPADGNNVAYRALLRRVSRTSSDEWLRRIVDRFLPGERVQPSVVLFGWSGDVVLRLSVLGTSSREYFLKLCFAPLTVERSLSNHLAAERWLGKRTVSLHPPLGGFLDSEFATLSSLFRRTPDMVAPLLPVCWNSGAAQRDLLSNLFGVAQLPSLRQIYSSLVDALAGGGQPTVPSSEPPISDPCKKGFFEDDGMRRRASILSVVQGLRRHASGVTGWETVDTDFKAIEDLLEAAAGNRLIRTKAPVLRGHTHWDPHSRNVLVAPKVPSDLVLIDCGDYRSDGFRVTDLALIEVDLKLVLMETDAPGFGDKDIHKVAGWLQLEKACLAHGLSLKPTQVRSFTTISTESARKAYELIAVVRQGAKAISAGDPDGSHYFASLLYRTLNWLTLPGLETPKKLLAVYSAARILERFR